MQGLSTWLTVDEAAAALMVTIQSVHYQVKVGKLASCVQQDKRSRGGKVYLVALESLPPEAQRRYLERRLAAGPAEGAGAPRSDPPRSPATINEGGGLKAESGRITTVAELTAKYGEQRAKSILAKPREREKIVLEALKITGTQREKTRRIEALAKKRKVSPSTLRRWMADWEAGGLIGLVNKRYLDPGRGLDAMERRTVTEEMRNFILAMYLRDMKPKGSHVYKELQKAAAAAGWDLPSRATIYRVIKEVSKSEAVRAHKGKEAWKSEVKPKTKRNYDNLMVMQEIVGDGHDFDVFVRWRGRAIRPMLSMWVDLRSRKIVGWCITPQANAESIGLALKHAIEDEGLPGTLYCDNGKDYLSAYIEAVCTDLEIDIRNCIPKTPQAKLIERTFEEVHDKFTRYLPGYCGNKPENRPEGFCQKKLLKAGKLLDIESLARRFGLWVEEYNNTVHRALGDTPANVAEKLERFRPGTVDARVLDVLFMKRERVKVHPGYIRLYGRDFWTFGTDIDWLIGKYVEVWYDFNHMGRILIKYNGKIVGTAENKKALDHGESRADLAAEQKAKAAFERETKRRIDAYAQGIPDELDGILPEDVLKRKYGRRYVTGAGQHSAGEKVHRITGHERGAAAAVDALAAEAEPAPAHVSRAKRMLLEEGRRALGQG